MVKVAANCKRLRDAKGDVETGVQTTPVGRVRERVQSEERPNVGSL